MEFEEKYYEEFDLTGKTLCFNFHNKSCYEELTGYCSVSNGEVQTFPDHLEHEKAHKNHCPYVHYLILNEPQRLFRNMYLNKYLCGHYQVGSNQHRLCISGLNKIKIPLTLALIPKECGFCEDPNSYLLKTF